MTLFLSKVLHHLLSSEWLAGDFGFQFDLKVIQGLEGTSSSCTTDCADLLIGSTQEIVSRVQQIGRQLFFWRKDVRHGRQVLGCFRVSVPQCHAKLSKTYTCRRANACVGAINLTLSELSI